MKLRGRYKMLLLPLHSMEATAAFHCTPAPPQPPKLCHGPVWGPARAPGLTVPGCRERSTEWISTL